MAPDRTWDARTQGMCKMLIKIILITYSLIALVLVSIEAILKDLTMRPKMEAMDVHLKSPFTAMLAGPKGSGKTGLSRRLIDNTDSMATVAPAVIICCYSVWQRVFEELEGWMTFHEGMLDMRCGVPPG